MSDGTLDVDRKHVLKLTALMGKDNTEQTTRTLHDFSRWNVHDQRLAARKDHILVLCAERTLFWNIEFSAYASFIVTLKCVCFDLKMSYYFPVQVRIGVRTKQLLFIFSNKAGKTIP